MHQKPELLPTREYTRAAPIPRVSPKSIVLEPCVIRVILTVLYRQSVGLAVMVDLQSGIHFGFWCFLLLPGQGNVHD